MNWIYCCGTPVLGYAPLVTSGSTAGTFQSGSMTSLLNYTLNVFESKTISSLTITTNFQLNTTQQIQCVVPNPANQGPPTLDDTGFPNCNVIGATNLILVSTGSFGSPNFTYNLFSGTITVQGPPAGTITWTVLKNGLSTGLTISTASNGTFTSTIPAISFQNGDTLALQVNNPSTVNDTLAAGSTWSVN